MGCGCGKTPKASASTTYTYGLTPPGGGKELEFLTMLEVRKELRRLGGGTVRRIGEASAPASDTVAAN